MPEALALAAALACGIVGFAWLALSMEVHWQQAVGTRAPARRTVRLLRMLGSFALVLSLLLSLVADRASMAVLVWIMASTAAALAVALTLAWRPRVLAPLVVCAGAGVH